MLDIETFRKGPPRMCEVIPETALPEGIPAPRFQTRTMQGADPVWNHTREIFLCLGDIVRLSTWSKDAWANDLLGGVELSYEQICPGGFYGEVLLKAHGRASKSALSVDFKVM